MRTTITLDKDVASRLEQLRQGRRFKELVNDVLRRGLESYDRKREPVPKYTVKTVAGRPRRTNLDNVAEVLAEIEGDDYS